jgi:hypothetical protein
LRRYRIVLLGISIVATGALVVSMIATLSLTLGATPMLSPFSASPDPGSADREAFCSEAVEIQASATRGSTLSVQDAYQSLTSLAARELSAGDALSVMLAVRRVTKEQQRWDNFNTYHVAHGLRRLCPDQDLAGVIITP